MHKQYDRKILRKGGGDTMRSRMAKQVQELQLRWSQESFWQEGQARGAVRVCKVMGLDQADTCEYLRALLPELPQADAERLIRYY